jgi:hypothetical protein
MVPTVDEAKTKWCPLARRASERLPSGKKDAALVDLMLGYASEHGGMVYPEALGGGPDRAPARDRKKEANVIPVDHMVQPCTIRRTAILQPSAAQFRRLKSAESAATAGAGSPAGSIPHHWYALNALRRRTHDLSINMSPDDGNLQV